jgi:hypothetical protein
MLMQFKELDDLKSFEQDTSHSHLREEVFSALERRSKTLYSLAQESKTGSVRRSTIYEAIESLVSPHFWRWDFTNAEQVSDLVKTVIPARVDSE